ncbi:uncharacterized protein LOC132798155 [Drosophila nasuta]|uniref:uncharacterized protein LOC132798155 n=1 Tax=Drosophila nasuta TaxID=42062 RepID=UPI00295E47D0|nr:uncharacterized protein LOC132798155 [Drosophila nasuta]
MVSTVRNLLCLTILAVLANAGYAIHCYICDSVSNPKCGQNLNVKEFESNLIDCNRVVPPRYLSYFSQRPKATACKKQTVKFLSGDQQIIRGCYFGDVSNKQGCQLDPNLNGVEGFDCDVCLKDGCNGLESLTPIGGAIILFFGVVRLLATRLLEVSLTVFP